MSKYFKTPFANTGDKTSIPDDVQPSGDVSFEEGWTPDYSSNQATDPNAKDIPRRSENYFKFAITEALKEIQETGGKVYDPLVDYPVGALIQGSDGGRYLCKIANGPDTSVVDPVSNPQTWAPKDKTVPFTTGGVLIAGAINEFQGNGPFSFPAADSVPVDGYIDVERPSLYQDFKPFINADGADTITGPDGTDTSVEVAVGFSIKIRFTSNGVDNWRY